jgi:hypothetical protein
MAVSSWYCLVTRYHHLREPERRTEKNNKFFSCTAAVVEPTSILEIYCKYVKSLNLMSLYCLALEQLRPSYRD